MGKTDRFEIITTPNPMLLETSRPVERFDKKLVEILNRMKITLSATADPVGVGLAAPQIGLDLRIFLMRVEENDPITAVLNPNIDSISDDPSTKIVRPKRIIKNRPKSEGKRILEGCLSMPNIWGHILRQNIVALSFQDVQGKNHTEIFRGFPAVIVQHEIDHLNGILFTKHVMEQGQRLYKSHKGKDGEDEFDEIKL